MAATNYVTPEAIAMHDILFNKLRPVCWTSKSDLSNTTKYELSPWVVNLVTPKAADKHELLFNKPASEVGLLNT